MSNRVAAALSSKPAKTDGKKWIVDKATKRTAEPDSAELAEEVRLIEESNLPPRAKAQAIANAKAAAAPSKSFGLAVAVAQEAGARDLIEVTGDFMPKMLSPNLLRTLADNAEFIANYLDGFAKRD